jgi:actin-related protein 6
MAAVPDGGGGGGSSSSSSSSSSVGALLPPPPPSAPSVVALYDTDEAPPLVRAALRREFVLPDFHRILHGFVRPLPRPGVDAAELAAAAAAQAEEQTLVIENERIAVPEVLFRPSDIGLRQAGVSEAVLQAVAAVPEALRGSLLDNILVVGGSSRLPNFCERLRREVRALAPAELRVSVFSAPARCADPAESGAPAAAAAVGVPDDALSAAWRGGAALGGDAAYFERTVTKAEYDEKGHSAIRERQLEADYITGSLELEA